MSATIPDSHMDLLVEPYYAVLTTISSAGGPENTVIWCSWDGNHVLVNTKGFARKIKNIKNNPQVALNIIDPKNPYRWIDIRGTVDSVTEDKEFANINAHAKKYRGVDEYYGGYQSIELKGKEDRVVVRIRPDRVFAFPLQG